MPRVLVLVADQNLRELRRLILAAAGFEVESPEPSVASRLMESLPFDALVLSCDEAAGCQWVDTFRRHNGRVVAVGTQGRVRLVAHATVDPFEPSSLVRSLQCLWGKSAPAD